MPKLLIPAGGSIPSPPSPTFTQSVCITRSGARKIIKYYKDGNRVTATGLPVTSNPTCITSKDCQCCTLEGTYVEPDMTEVNRDIQVNYHSNNTYRRPMTKNVLGSRGYALLLAKKACPCNCTYSTYRRS